MSDTYFDVSECIARKYPRSEVHEIDEFLTRANPLEIKLQDIEDSTNVNENAEAILNEYIKHGVVTEETRYFCPKHQNTVLQRPKGLIPSRKRICPKCKKSYSANGLESETIFIRKKAPDRPLPLDSATTARTTETPETPWWKEPKWIAAKWIAERIGIPVLLIFAAVIIRDALSAPSATDDPLDLPTATAQFRPSFTPTSAATPTTTITPTVLPNAIATPNS